MVLFKACRPCYSPAGFLFSVANGFMCFHLQPINSIRLQQMYFNVSHRVFPLLDFLALGFSLCFGMLAICLICLRVFFAYFIFASFMYW